MNFNSRQVTPKLLNSAIDTLEFRVFKESPISPVLMFLVPQMRRYKESWQQGDDRMTVQMGALGTFTVLPFGKGHYEFVLSNPELADIRIMNPERWDTPHGENTGHFYIRLAAKFLQQGGWPAINRFVGELVLSCYAVPSAVGYERISRVDMACDTHEARLCYEQLSQYKTRARSRSQYFGDDWKKELEYAANLVKSQIEGKPPNLDNKGGSKYIDPEWLVEVGGMEGAKRILAQHALETVFSPAGEISIHGSGSVLETMQFGTVKSEIWGKRYDKLREIKKSGKDYMKDVWASAGYKPDLGGTVVRTEFSVRGKALKEWNLEDGTVVDMRDLFAFKQHQAEVWAYLTRSWLTRRQPCEDVNESRWPMHSDWNVVQSAFGSAKPAMRSHPRRDPDTEALEAQIRGCALSSAAKAMRSDSDLLRAAEVAKKPILDMLTSDSLRRSLLRRREELGVDDYSVSCRELLMA